MSRAETDLATQRRAPQPESTEPSSTQPTASTTAPITSSSQVAVLPTTTQTSVVQDGMVPSVSASAASGPVAQIASSIISEIDDLSHGRYKLPDTSDNITLLEHWMANEGGTWADNPLNTSLNAGSYPHQFNGSQDTGIPIYPNIAAGVRATAQTLLQNPVYSSILSALSSGDVACQTFAAAVIRSPWASSHYGYDPARFCGGSLTSLKPPGTRGRRRA